MDKPVTVTHGPHTIKAGLLGGRVVARAFVTGGAPGVVAEAEAGTVEAAIDALTRELDARATRTAAGRRVAPDLGIALPTASEFRQALAVVKPHDAHRTLLRALALAGEDGLSLKALTFDAGYHDVGATTHQLGSIAEAIGRALGMTPPAGAPAWALLAGEARGTIVMHPELREAVLDGIA